METTAPQQMTIMTPASDGSMEIHNHATRIHKWLHLESMWSVQNGAFCCQNLANTRNKILGTSPVIARVKKSLCIIVPSRSVTWSCCWSLSTVEKQVDVKLQFWYFSLRSYSICKYLLIWKPEMQIIADAEGVIRVNHARVVLNDLLSVV